MFRASVCIQSNVCKSLRTVMELSYSLLFVWNSVVIVHDFTADLTGTGNRS